MLIHRFEHFLKNVNYGQPLHRTDLGHEIMADGILTDSGFSTATVALAPQLAQRKALELEAAPQGPAGPSLGLAPAAPVAGNNLNPPGPSLGLGGGGAAVRRYQPPPQTPPSDKDKK